MAALSKIQLQVWGRNNSPNVFAGGIASLVNSTTDLALLFGGADTNYRNLKKTGSDISFYSNNMDMFMNFSSTYAEDIKRNYITYIKQIGNKCRFSLIHRAFYHVTKLVEIDIENSSTELSTGSSGFVIGGGTGSVTKVNLPSLIIMSAGGILNVPNLIEFKIPNCIELQLGSFDYSFSKLPLLDIKKCKTIGVVGNTGSVFHNSALTSTAVINVNSFLLTSNSGGVNFYLLDLKSRKPSVTINFYDDAGNYVSTL